MKIVVLKGSPHKKGSSNLLAEQFVKGAKSASKFTDEAYNLGKSLR